MPFAQKDLDLFYYPKKLSPYVRNDVYPCPDGKLPKGSSFTAINTEREFLLIEFTEAGKVLKNRAYIFKNAVKIEEYAPEFDSTSKRKEVYQKETHVDVYTGPNPDIYEKHFFDMKVIIYDLGLTVNGYTFVEMGLHGMVYRYWIDVKDLSDTEIETEEEKFLRLYKTFYKIGNNIIDKGLVYGGAKVSQGFNDETSNNKGHFGYDIIGFGDIVKPIFPGWVVKTYKFNTQANGRTVTLRHSINGEVFYSTYSHLASVDVDEKDTPYVLTSAKLGIMGGSGSGKEHNFDAPGGREGNGDHLHLCVYTGTPQQNPNGYVVSAIKGKQYREKTFQDAAKENYNKYYYGPDEKKYPKCGYVCFYDPFGVVTSKAEVIKLYHP